MVLGWTGSSGIFRLAWLGKARRGKARDSFMKHIIERTYAPQREISWRQLVRRRDAWGCVGPVVVAFLLTLLFVALIKGM